MNKSADIIDFETKYPDYIDLLTKSFGDDIGLQNMRTLMANEMIVKLVFSPDISSSKFISLNELFRSDYLNSNIIYIRELDMYLSFKNNNDFVLFMARYIDLGILVNIQQVIPINERQPAGFTIRANMGDIMLVRRYVYEHMKKDTRITMYHGNENYQVILENHRCSNYMDTFPVVDGIFAYIEKEDPLLFKRITPMRLMINLQLNVCYVSHYVRCVNNVPSIEECLNYGPVKRPIKTKEVETPVDKNPSKEKSQVIGLNH